MCDLRSVFNLLTEIVAKSALPLYLLILHFVIY
jgi:hypothetical protein